MEIFISEKNKDYSKLTFFLDSHKTTYKTTIQDDDYLENTLKYFQYPVIRWNGILYSMNFFMLMFTPSAQH